jgi:hypothetical protein
MHKNRKGIYIAFSKSNLFFETCVAVHGLKLEIRNLGEVKRVYELDVYKLAEALSDMVWHDFDK